MKKKSGKTPLALKPGPAIDLGALQATLAKRRGLLALAQAETERASAHEQRMRDSLRSTEAQFVEAVRAIRGGS